jgi:hypothetical protein
VRRADLARLAAEPSAKQATRHYVSVHAILRRGEDQVLAAKVSPGAAKSVLRLVTA